MDNIETIVKEKKEMMSVFMNRAELLILKNLSIAKELNFFVI